MTEKTRNTTSDNGYRLTCSKTIVLILFLISNFWSNVAAQNNCATPTGHAANFDIRTDCGATNTVEDGQAYNIQVNPFVTYTFTICDPNYVAGLEQPYAELWDAPGGNFLELSTFDNNGCASITHSNCTPIIDYSLQIWTQHGTINFCEDDGSSYLLTTTCVEPTLTCPATIKPTIPGTADCCFTGAIPLPDLATLECSAGFGPLEISYTDCDGVLVNEDITLPDADGLVDVNLPIGSNPVTYSVTLPSGTASCVQTVIPTRASSCTDMNFSIPSTLDTDCSYTLLASDIITTCPSIDYNLTVTVNGILRDPPEISYADVGATVIVTVDVTNNGNVPGCGPIQLTINQDNAGPKMTCPADITLICGQAVTTDITGMPTDLFDCSGDVDVTFSDATVSDCTGSVITRTFTARDLNGNITNCVQTITLLPIDFNSIVDPLDYTGFPGAQPALSCEDFSLTNLPTTATTGGITINGIVLEVGMICSLVVSKEDEILEVCDGSFDILRTWKISDWCPPHQTVTRTQLIKVKVTDEPTGVAGLATVQNESTSCESTVIVEPATFTAGCSAISSTGYSTTIASTGSGFIFTIDNATAVFNNIPMGTYNITQCATDDCGNEGCVISPLVVADEFAPIAVCSERTVSLNGSADIAFCASQMSTGSYDNCGIYATKVKRMDADASVPFTDCITLTCADSGTEVMVRLRVYDMLGIYSATDDIPDEIITDVRFGECMEAVNVNDKECPTCPTFPDVTITCKQAVTDGVGYIADPQAEGTGVGEFNENTDNCDLFSYADAGITYFDSEGLPVATFPTCGGSAIQNWTLTDPNNENCTGQTCGQRITITATTWDGNVNITFPADVTVSCDTDLSTLDEPVLANQQDACGDLYISIENEKTHVSVNGGCQRVVRSWKVVDDCLSDPNDPNAGVYRDDQIIEIEDNEDPTFDVTPSDIMIDCNTTFTLPDFPTASDNCVGVVTVTSDQNTVFGAPDASGMYTAASGTYTVTYTATDQCSNTTTAQITVTIGDDADPVVVCNTIDPINLDLGTTCMLTLSGTMIATANDVCDGSLMVFVEQIADPSTPSTVIPTATSLTFDQNDVGVVFIQAWAMDVAGNTTSEICSFEITDSQGCQCGTGVTFDLTGSLNADCEATATVSNIALDGVVGTASDYTITWTGPATCGNVLTCTGSGGTYTATVTHNATQCTATDNVTITLPIVSEPRILADPGSCSEGDMNGFSLFSVEVDGVVITDFTGYNVSWFDSNNNLIAACADIGGATCPGQSSGNYFVQVTTPGGCVSPFFDYAITCTSPRIAGTIVNEEGDQLSDVVVEISDAVTPVVTDVDGTYLFEDLNLGGNYTVTPEKNNNPLNGVTTFDLVLITQHILGIQKLNSPYKLIAADANGSQSITTLDLVKIQRVILGIDQQFTATNSWRFIENAYSFPNPQNPFTSSFPEIFPINQLNAEMMNVDFVGVKIGDVNCTAAPSSLINVQNRNEGNLNFEINNQTIEAGVEFEVNFTSKEFNDLLGYQFTLQFDNELMEFVSVKSAALPELSENNFGLNKIEDGLMTSSWFSSDAVSQKEDDTLFTLKFKAKKAGDLTDAFVMTNGVTQKEAYQKFGETIKQLDMSLNIIGSETTVDAIQLYQNSPNPFKDHTNIQFYLPEAKSGSILIFDYSGKVVTEIHQDFQEGINEVTFDKSELQTTGILFYQLEIENFTATKKMLLID